MKVRTIFAFAALFCCVISSVFAQQPQSIASGLFIPAPAAPNPAVGYPDNSGFFRINTSWLKAIYNGNTEIETITGFPLGAKQVTLKVERFEVLTADAKIRVLSSKGKKPFVLPEYVLLHGTVEKMEGSHVYIAVFPDHALGYVEVSSAEASARYLIQPVSMNTEGSSTMIVYNSQDIDRSNDIRTACGTDSYTPNKKNLLNIEAQVSAHHLLEQQATPLAVPKNVKLLKVDVECDYDYYLDFKSDTTKALQYAIADFGAVSDVYLRDVNAGVMIQQLHLWTEDDPFPGSLNEQFLPEFQDYGNSTFNLDGRTSAILLSGVNNIGGLAYLGTMCPAELDNFAYASCGTENVYTFPKDGYIWDVMVVAHEFGHNLGSPHTHSCFWNPAIDSCVAAEDGACFSKIVPVKGSIMSYCHLTPKGSELKFHPRTITFLKNMISQADCAASVQLPSSDAGNDTYYCGTDSAYLSGDSHYGTPPYKYSWRSITSPNVLSKTQKLAVHPSSKATYIFSVTDANFLHAYDTVIVTPNKFTISGGGTNIVCKGDAISLKAAVTGGGLGAVTYAWVDSATGTALGTNTNLGLTITANKTIRLTATDSAGCVATAYAHLIATPRPEAAITAVGSTTLCIGDTVVLDAGAGFYSYEWSNAKSTRSIKVTTAGNYSVIVSNGSCLDTSAVVVVSMKPQPTKPTVQIVNGDLQASSGQTYQWFKDGTLQSDKTSQTLTKPSEGMYYVVVTNSDGCKSTSDPIEVSSSDVASSALYAVSISPNPASEEITMSWGGLESKTISITLTDLQGNVLSEHQIDNPTSSGSCSMDLRSYASGSYILKYTIDGKTAIRKFVKQ